MYGVGSIDDDDDSRISRAKSKNNELTLDIYALNARLEAAELKHHNLRLKVFKAITFHSNSLTPLIGEDTTYFDSLMADAVKHRNCDRRVVEVKINEIMRKVRSTIESVQQVDGDISSLEGQLAKYKQQLAEIAAADPLTTTLY